MCDYSLCGIPNRLAVEREELVVYRFSTGSIGMASLADLRVCERSEALFRETFWQAVKAFLKNPARSQPARGLYTARARLIVRNIRGFAATVPIGQEEAVVFTQLSSEFNSYRDAIRFRGDREVRLQDLREGMPVQVLSLENASEEYAPPAETVDSLV
jgi:hypothetical protein